MNFDKSMELTKNGIDIDHTFELIKEKFNKDTEAAKKLADDLHRYCEDILLNRSHEFGGIDFQRLFLALGYNLISVASILCEKDTYEVDAARAKYLAENKIVPSVMPLCRDGEIVDEDFEKDDLSLKKLLMSVGFSLENMIWRNELNFYSTKREELEKDAKKFEVEKQEAVEALESTEMIEKIEELK